MQEKFLCTLTHSNALYNEYLAVTVLINSKMVPSFNSVKHQKVSWKTHSIYKMKLLFSLNSSPPKDLVRLLESSNIFVHSKSLIRYLQIQFPYRTFFKSTSYLLPDYFLKFLKVAITRNLSKFVYSRLSLFSMVDTSTPHNG